MKNNEKRSKVVVLSGFNAFTSKSGNMRNHGELKAALKRASLSFKEVVGMYKGEGELSLVVPYTTTEELIILRALANEYLQESILLLEPSINGLRTATLDFLNGTTQAIGYLRAVDAEVAYKFDAYTHDFNTGEYYVAY